MCRRFSVCVVLGVDVDGVGRYRGQDVVHVLAASLHASNLARRSSATQREEGA